MTDTAADDTFAPVTNGLFTGSDPDTNDSIARYDVVGEAAASGQDAKQGFTHFLSKTYSTLWFNEGTGAYRIEYNDATTEGLRAGENGTDTYSVTAFDGTANSNTQILTVKVPAADDLATIDNPGGGTGGT